MRMSFESMPTGESGSENKSEQEKVKIEVKAFVTLQDGTSAEESFLVLVNENFNNYDISEAIRKDYFNVKSVDEIQNVKKKES